MGNRLTNALRRHAAPLIVAAIALDIYFVVAPCSNGTRHFSYWVTTIFSDLRADWRRPTVAVVHDAGEYRLLYGDEAKEHFLHLVAPLIHVSDREPFVQEHGFITPFYATCIFDFDVVDFNADIPPAEVIRLRNEFITTLLADPIYVDLPPISRAALAAPSVQITEISWLLLLHDTLFVLTFPVLGCVALRRALLCRRKRFGHCRRCNYDLIDLRSRRCPECGGEW